MVRTPLRFVGVLLGTILAVTLVAQETYRVERVVDGDTLILAGLGSVPSSGWTRRRRWTRGSPCRRTAPRRAPS
jgi:hypothetical protein